MHIRSFASLALCGLLGCDARRTAAPAPAPKREVPAMGGNRGAVVMDATLTVLVETASGVPVQGTHLRILSGTGHPERAG